MRKSRLPRPLQQTRCLNRGSGNLNCRRAIAPRPGPARLGAVLVLLLAACQERPLPPAKLPVMAGPAGAALFTLDPGASKAWFYLQADGPLTRLGHSHVISAPAMRGGIWLHPLLERSGCELQLRPEEFVVDDPGERAAAGGEFAPPLDAEARAGTRAHMLGENQLAAAQFPLIVLRCRQLRATAAGAVLDLTVTLRDRDWPLAVPVSWRRDGATLQARGEFSFRQSAVGLQPYSALLGALRVGDEVRARFELTARQP
jgi:polyisoprenoid-binding protein YceI